MDNEPQIIDGDCFWLFCIPVPPGEAGWRWKFLIWRKGDDHELTHAFKATVSEGMHWAAGIMNCYAGSGHE